MNMKKTYINPEIVVVKIDCSPLLLNMSNRDAITNDNKDYDDARYFDFDDEEEY